MVNRGWTQPRPALDRRLDGALTHRLTTLIAATGYGKSTLLSGWVHAVGGAIHQLTPADRDLTRFAGGVVSALRLRAPAIPAEIVTAVDAPLGPDAVTDELARASALAGAVAETLSLQLTRDLVLVLDGLNEIADAPGACRFVDTIVRTAPRRLHVVIASREALPFPTARLHQDNEVLALDATDLALTVDETAGWLEQRLGGSGAALAPTLQASCGGWPAAAHAAIDGMARAEPVGWPDLAASVTATSADLEALARAAFDDLPGPTRRLLQAATVVPILTDQLAAALGAAPDALATVASRGLFLEADADGCRLTPASRHLLGEHAPLDQHEAHDVAAVAARWYADHGDPHLALRTAVAARHNELITSLLATHGARLAEQPDDLLAALDQLSEEPTTHPRGTSPRTPDNPDHIRLAGLAHHNRGDWDTARAMLAQATDSPAFDSSVAYRLGVIDHLRGELDAALDAYQRGADHGNPPADAALCTAMAAAARWLRGDRAGCAELAEQARDRASVLGDHRALAAAHTVLAMLAAFDGDGRANDAHYLKALDHADQAGDVIQQIRIRTNRASHRHTEGAYTEAMTELEIAIRLCDLTGFAPWAALALSNRAETLIRLGRLEEATVDASDAADRWEAMGSRLVGYGLTRRAQIQALRGYTGAAAGNYKRAIALAEQSGDAQGLGNALSGLAELIARDEPGEAAKLADRALEHNVGTAVVAAQLAGAQAALMGGRPDDALRLLDDAAVTAGDRNERASLAAVTELRAELKSERALADDAVEQWTAVGNPVGLARAELVRAGIGDPRLGAAVAQDVRARMQAIGCRALDDKIDALVARGSPPAKSRLVIETLGAFRVVRDAVPVPRTEWQSRKARDLLKVLVTRRGRPIAREQLVETLWPDEDGGDESAGLKRLNVMVSTLRGVLDPGHEHPPDHMVVSGAGSLRIELAHVTVDVIEFLDLVAEAARLDQAGRSAEALEHWRAAEAAYTGEFCEEDAYADWATGLREEARLAYVQAAARIADAEALKGEHEQAARYWLRLLERDPYDERAHLALVRLLDQAGRRGDARRRYQVYANLMRELDIEPSPHPAGT